MIALFCYGWVKLPKSESLPVRKAGKINVQLPPVSIIVAARNEEKNIINCLTALINQNYSASYEIIIINDFSEDKTEKLVGDFIKTNPQKTISLIHSKLPGKKNAIEQGIKIAKGDIIATTDADCVMGENWLQLMVENLILSNNQLVIGPVNHQHENSVLEKFQTLELMSLIASGAASLYYNKAIMSNGANQVYYKQSFIDVGGYEGLKNVASGDDVLLMYKIKKRFGNKISFIKNEKAFVYTTAKKSIKDFLNQRIRWASKGFLLLNKEAKAVAFIVISANVSLAIGFLLCIMYFLKIAVSVNFLKIFLILLLMKWFIDFLLLFLASKFFNKKNYLIYFLPHQLFYSTYIFIVAVLSSFGTYEWKGRKVR